MTEKCYSINGEEYFDYDSLMDAIEDEEEFKSGDVIEVYEADSRQCEHSDFVRKVDTIGLMIEYAYDDHGEWAEDYLSEVTRDQIEALDRVISDWMDKNIKKPKFSKITGEKTINITVEKDD